MGDLMVQVSQDNTSSWFTDFQEICLGFGVSSAVTAFFESDPNLAVAGALLSLTAADGLDWEIIRTEWSQTLTNFVLGSLPPLAASAVALYSREFHRLGAEFNLFGRNIYANQL